MTADHLEPGAFRLGFIGVGHMASVIISALLEKETFAPAQLLLFDVRPENMEPFIKKGAQGAADTHALVKDADMIVLAVKPAQMESLLKDIGSICSGKCLVSIAAGITTAYIKRFVPALTHVARVMPNMTMASGCGATAIAKAPDMPPRSFERVCDIFSAGGIIEVVEETEMNAVIGVSGSSPAYFFRLVDVIAECAQAQGINRAAALRLAAKTMEGAAKMLMEEEADPAEYVRRVATPGGTTQAAMDAMDRMGFNDAVRQGMLACTRRARELAGD